MTLTIQFNRKTIGLALAFFVAAATGFFWGEQSFKPNYAPPAAMHSVVGK